MNLVIAGSLLTGIGLASIFPISVALFPRWFRDSAGRVSGAVFSGGNMGGAVLPWLVGVTSTRFESLRLGFFAPVLAVLLMLMFYVSQGISGRKLQTGTAELAIRP